MRRLLTLFALGSLAALGHAELSIDNFIPGDEVRYPVIVLRGRAEGPVVAAGLEGKKPMPFDVASGRYAAILELRPGVNDVVLKSGRDSVRMRIPYRPATSNHRLLTFMVRAADEPEGYRLSPRGAAPDYRPKLDVAMKLLQSFTAESMNAAGYGRKTFNLELGPDGRVVVHTIVSPKTGAELRAMENNASWWHVYTLLKEKYPEATTRWSGMLGFTTFDTATGKASGHYALGGGALALFGSGTMAHWPASLADVPRVFSDVRVLDPTKEFEDSAYRRTVWANVATAFGAMIHEIGHSLGLPHSADRLSVMSRGFDLFNRTFMPIEWPVAGKTDKIVFPLDEVTRWSPYFAARLNVNPFLQADRVPTPGDVPTITRTGDEIRIRAPLGIRVWGADADDLPATYDEHKEAAPPAYAFVTVADLRARLKSDKAFRITVLDTAGSQTSIDIEARPTAKP